MRIDRLGARPSAEARCTQQHALGIFRIRTKPGKAAHTKLARQYRSSGYSVAAEREMCCSVGVTVLGGANPGEFVVVVAVVVAVAATCPVVCAGVLKPVLKPVLKLAWRC